MTINELLREAFNNSLVHGFWDEWKEKENINECIPEKLCLIHSEVSEALESYREKHLATTISEKGKPEGFASELADVVIRLADLCGALGIDLEKELELKMEYNKSRPYKHGKVC